MLKLIYSKVIHKFNEKTLIKCYKNEDIVFINK